MTTPIIHEAPPDGEAAHTTCRRGATLLERAAVIERTDIRPRTRDAFTTALLDQLSASHYLEFLVSITRPASRHSLRPGLGEALTTATRELESAGYAVTRFSAEVGTGRCENLIAERAGTLPSRDAVLVTAHLDSINHEDGPDAPAPGADDNASGSAGLLELARVLATREWPHDLRLIVFGGEEQGLFGSTTYVAGLSAAERARIRAVVNMDMIARRNTAARGVLIEGAPASRHLIENLVSAAATWTGLTVSTSLNPFASDHVPFIDAGLPAVLTIEADDSANTDVHSARDTADKLDPTLAMEILRMNLAAIADALRNQE